MNCEKGKRMSFTARAAVSSVLGIAGFALLLFIPAGTLHYWQAWAFLGVFTAVSLLPSLYLNRLDPAAIERRRRAGPKAETRPVQKVIVTGILVSFTGMLVTAGLDRRYGWSQMPAAVSILGDIMVAVGLGISILVVFQNRYAAATITVEKGQPLASTGLYGIVRHPMYSASIVMMIGMALALGSYWALMVTALGAALLVARTLDEEKLLGEQLAGYRDYTEDVRYRLVPLVW